jgi:hypothetical protein
MAGKKTTKKNKTSKSAAPRKPRKAPEKVVSGGRGSPEAIEKRRVARRLNAILSKETVVTTLDGRSARKRDRILAELKDKQLKPVEVLIRVTDLLAMGETVASIKKAGVRPVKSSLSVDTDEVRGLIEQVQEAYAFPREAWKFIGVKLTSDVGAADAAE